MYDASNVRSSLQANVSTNDVIVPLITHTDRLYFDSGTSDADTGNLSYNSSTVKGVKYSQLKYAIRLHKIIEAIEDRYNITFSNDFFNSSNSHYYNLFMWLHRKKGDVENLSGVNQSLVDGFTSTSIDTGTQTQIVGNSTLWVYGDPEYYSLFTLTLNTTSTAEYTFSVLKNGVQIYREKTTGNKTISITDVGG